MDAKWHPRRGHCRHGLNAGNFGPHLGNNHLLQHEMDKHFFVATGSRLLPRNSQDTARNRRFCGMDARVGDLITNAVIQDRPPHNMDV